MPEYLLELFVSGGGSTAAGAGAGRVREAADTVTAQGKSVRYLRSMFVAAEETCFVLLEADTVEIVHDVALMAQVNSNRISEVALMPDLDEPSPNHETRRTPRHER